MIIQLPWLPWANAMAPFPGLVLIDWFHWRRITDEKRFALIAHEWRHHEQQRKDGWLTFLWRWYMNDQYREHYEHQADMKQASVFNRLT